MMEDIKGVEVIKGSIETVLEVIRDIYKADICALFLIMEEMHEEEKLMIFEERLKSIEKAYKKEKRQMPPELQKYWDKYNGNRENLRLFLNEVEILKFRFKEAQNPNPSIPDPNPSKLPGRLWKYRYNDRPSKWVIFKNYKEKDRAKSILFEGLTAYAVRTEMKLFIPNSIEMKKYSCITHLNARTGITPECKMMVFLPLRDPRTDRVIGLLKIENYSEIDEAKDWFCENCVQTKEARKNLPLLVKLIKKSEEFYDEYSYEKLYGGIRLLALLNDITPKGALNHRIYNFTYRLFLVLYRKEYVGHEEIMTRVTHYADDLAYELDISSNEFFKRLLERFKRHEDLLLYETEGYRDHFMHQFHVFIAGYIILNYLGLDKICKCVNNSLKHTQPNLSLTEENILRIWFLTSFMHDIAYIFESKRFTEGINNFLREEWGYEFGAGLNGEKLIDIQKPFTRYLSEMLGYFKCEKSTNHQEVLPYYLDSMTKMNDHGILSALWLINKFSKDQPVTRIAECYLSSLAASFHNSNIFRNLSEDNQDGISFESFPIPFILAFCDTIQIWGRTRETQVDVHPWLLDAEFNANEVKFKVFYKTLFPSKIPVRTQIRNRLVQDKDVFFRSSKSRFTIEFYGGHDLNNLKVIDKVFFRYSGP